MRNMYFLILTLLLGSIFAYQGIQNNVGAQNDSLKLRLNNEEMGTTDDTSVLSKQLEEIFKAREENGVFRANTNEVEKSVYLEGDRSVSVEEIAKLFGVLNDSGAFPVLIPVKVPLGNSFPKPNPLTLLVYAGSGESLMTRSSEISNFNAPRETPFTVGEIEIGFMEELPENGAIVVAVDKKGAYTMGGKQISASALKIQIKNRLKTKQNDKKTIFVQAKNYGNMQNIASIAHSAGAVRLYFMTKNN